MNAWIWLGLALAATAVGQILFKYASARRSLAFTLAVIACFGVATLSAFMALQVLSLATVYVSTAICQVVVVLAAMVLFGDHYRPRQWAGLTLILFGVVVFNVPNIG